MTWIGFSPRRGIRERLALLWGNLLRCEDSFPRTASLGQFLRTRTCSVRKICCVAGYQQFGYERC